MRRSASICVSPGATEEAEAASLALKVGPAAHQPARLIIEMREFDLQSPFGRRGTLAEDLEDQPGAIDHLDLQPFFQVALLDRREAAIDDQQFGFFVFQAGGDDLHLPAPEQRRRPRGADAESMRSAHLDADGERKPPCLVETGVGIDRTRVGQARDRR
jgi:hypothetical protein